MSAIVWAVWEESAGGGKLGAGIEDAGHDHGDDQVALAGATAGDEGFEAALAQAGEDGGDMAVGQGADDVKGVMEGDVGGGGAFEEAAQGVNEVGREFGEVGKGAFSDLAVFPEGLAQEDGGRGVAVGDDVYIHD